MGYELKCHAKYSLQVTLKHYHKHRSNSEQKHSMNLSANIEENPVVKYSNVIC